MLHHGGVRCLGDSVSLELGQMGLRLEAVVFLSLLLFGGLAVRDRADGLGLMEVVVGERIWAFSITLREWLTSNLALGVAMRAE